MEDKIIPFSTINDYVDGKELIQKLSSEAFDELVKSAGTSTKGSDWYEYLVQLSMKGEEEVVVYDPFDFDN